ncbi:nucleotidyltransferase family protein [Fibrobacterota bacterium]
MKSRKEILSLLSKMKPELVARFKVRKIALFGSYAREEQNEASDVDILVDIDPSIGLEFVSMSEKIEHLLGIPVQVVSHRAIKKKRMKFIEQDLIHV